MAESEADSTATLGLLTCNTRCPGLLQSPAMANLHAIIKELQQERDGLDAAIEALTSLGRNTPRAGRGPRTMSAAARRRIAAAQRARWAKQKGGSATNSARPKRHISAAGLARIRAAARARWAKVRAGKK
jgi:hypothetical protein